MSIHLGGRGGGGGGGACVIPLLVGRWVGEGMRGKGLAYARNVCFVLMHCTSNCAESGFLSF